MSEEADVIVIGSGVAGALCAYALARRGIKVLVLEAGPRIERSKIVEAIASAHGRDLSSGYPNQTSAPRPDWSKGDSGYIRQNGPDVIRIEYLRVVGGTTWHWTGGCDRLLPADFQLRSTYGVGLDWPISYEDLEPFYLEAERELGVAGESLLGGPGRSAAFPLPPVPLSYADKVIGEKLRDIGIRLLPRPAARNTRPYEGRPVCDGYGTCAPICPIGAQYGAIVHVEKAERIGVRFLSESRVDRLRADASGRIIEAQFGRPDGSTGVATGRIFVLAANGIESPRLLLASADESFPHGLANSSDQVGRNYMDHFGHQIRFEASQPLYPNRAPVFTSYIDGFRDGPLRASEAALMIYPTNQIDLFDLTVETLNSGIMPPALDKEIRERAARSIAFEVFSEQLPQPDNRLTIDRTDLDAAGQPRIRLSYSVDEYARAGLRRGLDVIKRVSALLGARNMTVRQVNGYNHTLGALRMGRNAKASVVDEVGRSHDHPNFFVASGAVFPTSAAASPTLTIAALALRTANVIAQQLV